MATWFKLLPLELAEVRNFKEPTGEVEPGEHQLGPISDELKAIHTLAFALAKEAEKQQLEAKYADTKEARDACNLRYEELARKAAALSHLFVVGLCEDFKCWDKQCIVLRKGWIAVWIEPPTNPLQFVLRQ